MPVKERNVNIDLVKVIASLCVVSVHFFLNTGFYNAELHGYQGLVLVIVRTALMVCVPLFLIATGYLMKNKVLTRNYYIGILRLILIYIFASVLCLIWRITYFLQDYSFLEAIESIMNYSACSYSWYIEMYLGLFLLIPFLNVVYINLSSRKRRQTLLITLVLLVALPPQLNFMAKILPSWWSELLYPVLYYYLGSYLRDYPLGLRSVSCFIGYVAWVVFCASFNYIVCINSEGNTFGWNDYTDWGSIQNFVSSLLLFSFIMSLKLPRSCTLRGSIVNHLSRYSLATYLMSWILDKTLYPILMERVGTFEAASTFFPLLPLGIYVGAAMLSAFVTELSDGCYRTISRYALK